jgi:NADH:ubiquinone oxidoreductase subunit 2 (subunit N)
MKIANAMFMKQAVDAEPVSIGPGMRLALTIAGVGTIGIGIFPNLLIQAVYWSLNSGPLSSIAQLVK